MLQHRSSPYSLKGRIGQQPDESKSLPSCSLCANPLIWRSPMGGRHGNLRVWTPFLCRPFVKKMKKCAKNLAYFSVTNLLSFPTTFSPQTHHNSPSKTPRFATGIRKTPSKNATPPREKNYKIYRERSWSFTMEATCCRTYSGSTTITFSTPVAVCRSITGRGGEGV